MRVVLLITDLELGGTPLRIARLARGLRDVGLEVHVGCLAAPGPVSRMLEADAIATFACHARGAADLTALARLARHLRSIRPDLVHSTLVHANVAARLVCGFLAIPVVGSTATIEVERRWHLWLERLTARRDAAHLVHSEALAEHVRRTFRLPPERVHVVPLSIAAPRKIDRDSARRELGLPPDAFVLAWAGRFDPVKRVDALIESCALLADEHVVLVLAGDGPEHARLRNLAEKSGARDRIRFLGWQDDLSLMFSAADAFALPSLTEGMPNVVLEALAAGVPVIASDIPALRNIAGLADGLLLLPSGSGKTAGAIADAVRRLRREPGLAQFLAERGRGWAGGLDPAQTVRAVVDVYKRVRAARH